MFNALFDRTIKTRAAAAAKIRCDETTSNADFEAMLTHRDRSAIRRHGKTLRTKFRARFAR